jgi:D-beta-D-heptose 7-phosphate kinase/D-beta-D-heptose 1-phosphate adenosyltransferase
LNSDDSVRRIKGNKRPINQLEHRAEVIGAIRSVDYVTYFEEDTPFQIISELKPDILVKGGDWSKDQIVGRDIVEKNGGQVYAIEFEKGYSTTRIIKRIQSLE